MSTEFSLIDEQKVRSASHTSFSVLGLCISLFLGCSTILLEMAVEPVLGHIQRRRKTSSHLYQPLEWMTNETLQLQRMAHEGIGAGTWIGTAETVPTTVTQESLAILDVSEAEHPRLVYQEKEMSNNTREERPSSTQLTQATLTASPCYHQTSNSSPSSIFSSPETAEVDEAHDPLAAASESQGAGHPSRGPDARTLTSPRNPQPTSITSPLSGIPSQDAKDDPHDRSPLQEGDQCV